jgi:hypothetical protein
MKIYRLVSAVVLLFVASFSHAYIVEDVLTFNKVYNPGHFVTLAHDMRKHGFVPDGTLPSFTLKLEIRDPKNNKWEWPFYMVSQGHGFDFGRVQPEGFVINPDPFFINREGYSTARFTVLEGSIWIGRSILTMDIKPIPAPSSGVLLVVGVVGMLLLRRRNRNLANGKHLRELV